jgi:predicted AAA+ superfamily ATPase
MTMLQRDIRDLANISDLTAVPRLLSVVAARVGGLLNFADLSRTMGLRQTTLKRYLALLYWRTASGQEVDVVLEDRTGQLAGIEVQAAATMRSGDVRGLQA